MIYIIIIFILITFVLKKQLLENFTTYTMCKKKKLHGITREIFEENNIDKTAVFLIFICLVDITK